MGSLFTKGDDSCAWSPSYVREQLTTCMQMGGVSHMVLNFSELEENDVNSLIYIREYLRANSSIMSLVNEVWTTKAEDIESVKNMLRSLQLVKVYLKYSWMQIVKHLKVFAVDLTTMDTFEYDGKEEFVNYTLFKIATHHHMKKLSIDVQNQEVRESVILWGFYMWMVVSDCNEFILQRINVTLDNSCYFHMFLPDKDISAVVAKQSNPAVQTTHSSPANIPHSESSVQAPQNILSGTTNTGVVFSLDPQCVKYVEISCTKKPPVISEDDVVKHIHKCLNGIRVYYYNII